MGLRLICSWSIWLAIQTLSWGQISGIVYDQEQLPLAGATVLLLPDSLNTTTDATGAFSLPQPNPGQYRLQIFYLGHDTHSQAIKIENNQRPDALRIQLQPQTAFLDAVTVTDEHAKQEQTLATEHFNETLLERNLQGTFAKSIEKIPGISAINVGVGIAKPVIRGLAFNRIIVNNQGIKQESQQWGADHGLELDQFDVERVEIIKGPASLQYGSDGLGGVINVMPGRIPVRNTYGGSITALHKTNNEHWAGSVKLGFNINDWFLMARYSEQAFSDYRVPANRFVYNSFDLPILNERLKNTAGREQNIHLNAGLKRDWGITRISMSRYSLEAGLFAGAVGIPRAYALTDDGNNRDIDIPKQEVDHYRIALNQTLAINEEDHLNINIGYQYNNRREFSFPEFHSIPSSQIDPGNTLAIQLRLRTLSANIHYEQHLPDESKMIYGANVQWQRNERGGFEFLLPNFRTFRSGAFILREQRLKENIIINGGLRLDYGHNDSDFFRQWVWDSNENITDSLIAPITDDPFFNWSASAGMNIELLDGRMQLKANLGKSFRVPYPSETVSNGIHHGTFRHERGTADLKSEHGYQADLSVDWTFENFSGSAATYFNYFDNYIYLGPTAPARFSPLPEAGQIFQYRQDDAIYTGFEVQWAWQVWRGLSVAQTADFVHTYNLDTRLALPFTPQPALRSDLKYEIEQKGWLKHYFVEIGHQFHAAASRPNRVDRSEQPTPAYQLWQIGAGVELKWGQQALQVNLQVQNLFDTNYLNHLSRYRLLNIPEQGRNIVISVKVPFGGKWRQ